MRAIAAQLANHLCRRKPGQLQNRNFSSFNGKEIRLLKKYTVKIEELDGTFRAFTLFRLREENSFLTLECPLINTTDELSLEEEAERKIGWFLKLLFAGTATVVAYQFFPYMGENLLQQSVSLLQVKDPLFKRMGASRLARFAVDDERRMKIVEIGGAQELLNMLSDAKDDKTRKEALKALAALSSSEEAAGFLHRAGAVLLVKSASHSLEDAEAHIYKTNLLKRFRELKYD